MTGLWLAYLDWDYEGERIIGVFEDQETAWRAVYDHGNGGDGRVRPLVINQCIDRDCRTGEHSYAPPVDDTHIITRHSSDDDVTVELSIVARDAYGALLSAIHGCHGAHSPLMGDGAVPIGYIIRRVGQPTYTFRIGGAS